MMKKLKMMKQKNHGTIEERAISVDLLQQTTFTANMTAIRLGVVGVKRNLSIRCLTRNVIVSFLINQMIFTKKQLRQAIFNWANYVYGQTEGTDDKTFRRIFETEYFKLIDKDTKKHPWE
jgi:hypothetical protein